MTINAILLMAGKSTRFNLEENKITYQLLDKPIFSYSFEILYNHQNINHIYLVVSNDNETQIKEWLEINQINQNKVSIVIGGVTRSESVRNALKYVSSDYVLIHDAARPLITTKDIDNLVISMNEYKVGTLFHPIYDTVKDTSNGVVTINRDHLKAVSTPQFFSKELYDIILNPSLSDEQMTDELTLFENQEEIAFVKETTNNKKVTTKEDLLEVTYSLEKQSIYKIGHSFDFHPFCEDRKLILGGVNIEFDKGLSGHSDADVLYHVIAESVMGALSIGDLGTLFPDTDKAYLNMDSSYFVKEVMKHVFKNGYKVENIDAIIYLEKPNLKKIKPLMASNIKKLTNCNWVNVKATTLEKKGLIGNGLGIACEAVVLLKKNS